MFFAIALLSKLSPEFSGNIHLITYCFHDNPYLDYGFYQDTDLKLTFSQKSVTFFRSFQRTFTENSTKMDVSEYLISYKNYESPKFNLSWQFKYSDFSNSLLQYAFMYGNQLSMNQKFYSMTIETAISDLRFKDKRFYSVQIAPAIQFYWNDFSFIIKNYMYRNDYIIEQGEKIINYLEIGPAYFGDYIGLHATLSSGEKYLLQTFENSYLNSSPDEFEYGMNLGIVTYPLLRTWSIGYEYRKSYYKLESKTYFIDTHLLSVFFKF
jgi:hypothetical protein